MDPNETLDEIRRLRDICIEQADGGVLDSDDVYTLCERIKDLDVWLAMGGALPGFWSTEARREAEDANRLKGLTADGLCASCLGYGHIAVGGAPSIDRRDRKCLDCRGEGK